MNQAKIDDLAIMPEVSRLLKQGHTIREASERCGLAENKVQSWLRNGRLAIDRDSHKANVAERRTKVNCSNPKVVEANKLILTGMSRYEIANKLGVTRQTISDWMEKGWIDKDDYIKARQTVKDIGPVSQSEIDKMVKDGLTVKQICDKISVPSGTIYYWVKQGDLREDTFNAPRKAKRQANVDKARQMEKDGYRQMDIAKKLGVCQSVVSDWLIEARKSEGVTNGDEHGNRGRQHSDSTRELMRKAQRERHEGNREAKVETAKQMLAEGATPAQVGEAVELSPNTIYKWRAKGWLN